MNEKAYYESVNTKNELKLREVYFLILYIRIIPFVRKSR